MALTIYTTNILLPILYFIGFLAYLYDFIKESQILHHSKRIILLIIVLIHFFYLLIRTLEFNHPPITTKFEIFTVLAFSICLAYFLLELLTDIRGTGLFILIFSLIFQIISSALIQDNLIVPEVLRSRLLGIHVISAILGYSGFTISAVYGFLFTLLYKEIKLNKFGIIFNRLPSLETLEKLSYYSVLIGFLLLSISIIIGIIWMPDALDEYSYSDPKLISTLVVWFIYGAILSLKLFAHWSGKRIIQITMFGFIFLLLVVISTNILAKTFHSFY
jgi:ABC-type uncharacterized transport system permease subunit